MIRITKNGFEFVEETDKCDSFAMLRQSVGIIDEDVTVGDIIKHVANNEALNIFFTAYSSCPIDEFFDALNKCTPAKSELDCAYVYKFYELTKKKDGYVLESDEHFSGSGLCDDDADPNFGQVIDNWSVSEMPVEQLATLPIRIPKKNMFIRYDNTLPKSERYSALERLEEVSTYISLLEFLDAILYDISFSGGPAERITFMDGIRKMVEEIKSGEAKTEPIDFEEPA